MHLKSVSFNIAVPENTSVAVGIFRRILYVPPVIVKPGTGQRQGDKVQFS
jgi:hypothetical protein